MPVQPHPRKSFAKQIHRETPPPEFPPVKIQSDWMKSTGVTKAATKMEEVLAPQDEVPVAQQVDAVAGASMGDQIKASETDQEMPPETDQGKQEEEDAAPAVEVGSGARTGRRSSRQERRAEHAVEEIMDALHTACEEMHAGRPSSKSRQRCRGQKDGDLPGVTRGSAARSALWDLPERLQGSIARRARSAMGTRSDPAQVELYRLEHSEENVLLKIKTRRKAHRYFEVAPHTKRSSSHSSSLSGSHSGSKGSTGSVFGQSISTSDIINKSSAKQFRKTIA